VVSGRQSFGSRTIAVAPRNCLTAATRQHGHASGATGQRPQRIRVQLFTLTGGFHFQAQPRWFGHPSEFEEIFAPNLPHGKAESASPAR